MHVIHGNLSDVIAHRWMCKVTSFNSGILHPDFMRYMCSLYEFMDLLMHVFVCACICQEILVQVLLNIMKLDACSQTWIVSALRAYTHVMHLNIWPSDYAWEPEGDSVSWIVYAWMNFNGWKRYALGTVVCRHVQESGTPRCRSRWQWSLSAHGWEAWHRTHWAKTWREAPTNMLLCTHVADACLDSCFHLFCVCVCGHCFRALSLHRGVILNCCWPIDQRWLYCDKHAFSNTCMPHGPLDYKLHLDIAVIK